MKIWWWSSVKIMWILMYLCENVLEKMFIFKVTKIFFRLITLVIALSDDIIIPTIINYMKRNNCETFIFTQRQEIFKQCFILTLNSKDFFLSSRFWCFFTSWNYVHGWNSFLQFKMIWFIFQNHILGMKRLSKQTIFPWPNNRGHFSPS